MCGGVYVYDAMIIVDKTTINMNTLFSPAYFELYCFVAECDWKSIFATLFTNCIFLHNILGDKNLCKLHFRMTINTTDTNMIKQLHFAYNLNFFNFFNWVQHVLVQSNWNDLTPIIYIFKFHVQMSECPSFLYFLIEGAI